MTINLGGNSKILNTSLVRIPLQAGNEVVEFSVTNRMVTFFIHQVESDCYCFNHLRFQQANKKVQLKRFPMKGL